MALDEQPFLVQAVFSFKGKNNDELCFKKGDIITVTQPEDGGWWEGTLNEKTGWFPSNYVKEYKVNSECLSPSKVTDDALSVQRAYRSVVLKDFLEAERTHVSNLRNFIGSYLQPLEKTEILSKDEYHLIVSNIKDILGLHANLVLGLETVVSRSSNEQRVGNMMITIAPQVKQTHLIYCGGHPRAVSFINKHKQELSKFAEEHGGNFISLTSGLSQPFRRLEKYSNHLQEVERHMQESHPDRGDTQRAISVYKDIAESCSVLRRQKELELEVVSGGVRGWEGQDLSTLGEIIHMGSVAVGPEHRDRYLVLFHTTLLILSVSHRMSAFIYEGKLPLTGIKVNKLEDTENFKNAFEISGHLIDRIVAVCQTKEDQNKWVSLISEQCNIIGAKASSLPVHKKSKSLLDDIPPDAMWSVTRLRPSPPSRPCLSNDKHSKSNAEKNFEGDAQILKVIESYCSNNSRYTVASEVVDSRLSAPTESTTGLVDSSLEDVMKKVNTLRDQLAILQDRVLTLTLDMKLERSAREKLENQLQFLISSRSISSGLIDNKSSITSL